MIEVRLDPPWTRPEVLGALGLAPSAAPAGDGSMVLALPSEAVGRLDVAMAVLGLRREPVATGGPLWAYAPDPQAARRGEPAAWPPPLAAEVAAELLSLAGEGRAPAELTTHLDAVVQRAHARVCGRSTQPPRRLRLARGADDALGCGLRRPYARLFAVEEHELRHRRFDGSLSARLERTVLASGDAVTVLPYDPARERVLLIEQFRPGPFARRDRLPWCLEAIAGRCDPGESPETTARREAREEAGLALGRLERVAGYYPSPGTSAEFTTAFVGEADLGAGEGVFGCSDEHEDIRTLIVPRSEAMAALAEGEVNNAPLLVLLLWLDRHAERLAQAWR